jgi:hypothetical protein
LELIGDKAPFVTVDLIVRTIELHKQVEFEGGKAGGGKSDTRNIIVAAPSNRSRFFLPTVVLLSSLPLLHQITFAMKAIDQTCEEFEVHSLFAVAVSPAAVNNISVFRMYNRLQVPYLHMRLEGHTSFSKKSTDGGKATSDARANAVCNELIIHGVPEDILHPIGHGCSRPLTKNPKDAANRRVEIHVMDEAEAKAHMEREAMKKAIKKRQENRGGRLNPLSPQ